LSETRCPPDRRTAEDLLDFVDTASVGLHWVAADGTILWANRADYEPLGYSAEEYLGHNIREFHADGDVLEDILARLARGERITDYQATLRCKDGSYRRVAITSSALFDEQNHFVHTRCFTRIVGEEGYQSHLPASEKHADALRLLVETVRDYAIFLLDPTGHIETWNAGAERFKGYRADEVIGQHFSIFYTSQDIAAGRPQKLLARAASQGRVEDEGWRVRKDGSPFWANVVITALRDSSGRLYGFGKVTRDLTARKQAEHDARRLAEERAARAAAEEAEARLRFLADAGATLAASLDYEGTLCKLADVVVPRLADWSSVSAVDDSGTFRRLAVVTRDPGKAQFAREYETKFPPLSHRAGRYVEVLETGRTVRMPVVEESLVRAAAQSEDHLRVMQGLGVRSCMMVPVLSRGKVIGLLSLARSEPGHDYGEADQVLAEEVARRAALAIENARLYQEQIRARKDAQTQRDRLEKLATELHQALQTRDDFLSVAGHELRTPLAAMLLHMESVQRLAQKEAVPPRALERLVKASAAGRRLQRLIDQVLDVSRIQSGRLSLEAAPTDLMALARDVVARYGDSGTPVNVQGPAELIGLWDPGALDQVVTNLLSNALKYGEGKPVDVEVSRIDDRALLRVTDRGIGIPEAEQAKIFERFERASAAKEFAGLGLGLWIARQVVEASGGTIGVTSAPGMGSTFAVSLPLGNARGERPGASGLERVVSPGDPLRS
jgi:PAS domain S-box-containing protein